MSLRSPRVGRGPAATVRGATAAGWAAGAVFFACGSPAPETCAPYTPELRRFIAEAGEIRPTAARLCGGFRHAPFAAGEATGGGTDPAARSPSVERGIARSAMRIQRAAGGGTAEELAAAGVVAIVAGRRREAVAYLEQAVERAPRRDPRYLVDLANAYLGRSVADEEPLDLLLAAETAEHAVEIAPEMPEALFTLAVALERVGLGAEAALIWQRSLAVETEGGWADEARKRIAQLATGPVEDFETVLLAAIDRADHRALRLRVDRDRQRARELGERLLGEWAEAESAGDVRGAAHALVRAGALGRVLADLGGDRLLADSVVVIERAGAAPLDPAPRRRLVAGHLAHAAGRAADADYLPAVARERFAEAERELAAAGSPFAGRSKVQRAAEAHRLSLWEETLTASAELIADAGVVERYPSLAARAHWLHGLAQLVAGSASVARDHYVEAIAGFARAGEAGNAAYVRGLLGEERWFVGERSAAWALWLDVLAGFDRLSPRNRHALADVMADSLADLRLPRLELRLRDRLVGADDVDGAVYRCFARLKRCRPLLRLDRRAEARRDLEIAGSLLPAIEDDELRELLRVDLLVSRSRIADDPAEAGTELTEAIDFYSSRGRAFPLTQLYFARARIHRPRGDLEAAELDLRAAVTALEGQRGEIRHVMSRAGFLAGAEAIFDELISLLAEQPGREAEALMAAEQGRSRTLLDLALRSPRGDRVSDLEAVTPQPVPPLERILEALPGETEAVAYAVLEGETVAWILRGSGVEMLRLEVSEAELAALARELFRSGSQGSAEAMVAGERLSELVYRPVARRLSAGATLVVVPDGPLAGIPFGLLGGDSPGRFLIEERAVAILPAAALLVGAGRGPGGRKGGRPPLLFGPPATGPTPGGPPRLRGAEREVARIAEIHPGAGVVTGSAATEAAFLRGLYERDLVHFAGHAEADPRDPLGSALILSASGIGGQPDGRLEAREILRHRFDHAPTVILAACATHDHAGRPETGITLATALLAAGAGGVVATLWPVEDEVTEEMMVELHRELAAGAGLAEALARVQRRALEAGGPSRVHDGSAWVVLGLCSG